jgi:hypothetical protein
MGPINIKYQKMPVFSHELLPGRRLNYPTKRWAPNPWTSIPKSSFAPCLAHYYLLMINSNHIKRGMALKVDGDLVII